MSTQEKSFLKKLIDFSKEQDLQTMDLRQQEDLISTLGEVPKPASQLLDEDEKTTLKEQIKKALNYTQKRSNFYPKYFQEIGIKSCVYCNSQLTVVIDRRKKSTNYKARFQVDHYYSQNKYPYLSITLLNLYPTCGSCNNAKKDNIIPFALYQDKVIPSEYSFDLSKKSLAKYLLSKNYEDLEIQFNDPRLGQTDSFEHVFEISSIYATQRDVAEEQIIKALIYNKSYKSVLGNSFKRIVKDPALIDRIIFGNYTEPHEIHQRPLSKFMQDITKNLKGLDWEEPPSRLPDD